MCTHILSAAEELADKVGILKEGQLMVEASPKQLKDTYGDSLEGIFLQITQR